MDGDVVSPALLRLALVARDWHEMGAPVAALPATFGIRTERVDEARASLLGFSLAERGRKLILLNGFLVGSDLEPLILAHEVSHFVIGLCEDGYETCGGGAWDHHCELLAWAGAALFLLRRAGRDDGAFGRLSRPLALLRLALADRLGEFPVRLGMDAIATARMLARAAQNEARRLRFDAIKKSA